MSAALSIWVTMYLVVLFLGLFFLIIGSDFFIEYAASLAKDLGMSQHLVGITIVAFATSLPEILVSVISITKGEPNIAVGNIIGSNVTNIGIALSISAVVMFVVVSKSAKFDALFMCAITGLLFLFVMFDGMLNWYEGLSFLALYGLYVFYLAKRNVAPPQGTGVGTLSKDLFYTIAGAAGLILGAELMIRSAIGIAGIFNISTLLIGFTLVAIGTSLPEIASTITAALKKKYELAVGNIVGSNIINILLALGLVAFITDIPFTHEVTWVVIPFTIIFSLVLAAMTFNDRISKREGWVLLGGYIVFLYLIF